MPYNIPHMNQLIEKGLNLKELYQTQQDLYAPQPIDNLLKKLKNLRNDYVQKTEKKPAGVRKKMLDFIDAVVVAIEKLADNKDNNSWANPFSWTTKKTEQKPVDTKEIDKLKAWIVTGLLVLMRCLIYKTYKNSYASSFSFVYKSDPNNSVLYKLMGDILCPPTRDLNIKSLNDTIKPKSKKQKIPYYGMAQSLLAFKKFISNNKVKSSYLSENKKWQSLLEDYTSMWASQATYQLIMSHSGFLEKQEKVVASINAAYQEILKRIGNLTESDFDSVKALLKAMSSIKAEKDSAYITELLNWLKPEFLAGVDNDIKTFGKKSLKQCFEDGDVGKAKGFKNFQAYLKDKLVNDISFFFATITIGAHLVLKEKLSFLNVAEDKPIIKILNAAIFNTDTNSIDKNNITTTETLIRGIDMYHDLVELLPNSDAHYTLWGGKRENFYKAVCICKSRINPAKEPTKEPAQQTATNLTF